MKMSLEFKRTKTEGWRQMCYKFILIFKGRDCQNMFIGLLPVCGTQLVIEAHESLSRGHLGTC